MTNVEHSVYALYEKSRRMGVSLLCLFAIMTISGAALGPKIILSVPYDSICNARQTHTWILYYG